MNDILQLLTINFSSTLLNVFIIFTGFKTIMTLTEWMSNKLGLEFKWMRKKREDHNLLLNTVQRITNLEEQRNLDVAQSMSHDRAIREDLSRLTEMFIDKEIDDMRWEIINFATKVSECKPCNKDSYKHCLRIYEKYEKILSDNNRSNGEVEISIGIIKDSYKEKMKLGF